MNPFLTWSLPDIRAAIIRIIDDPCSYECGLFGYKLIKPAREALKQLFDIYGGLKLKM